MKSYDHEPWYMSDTFAIAIGIGGTIGVIILIGWL